MQPGVLVIKNEAQFLPYDGKGIRYILVRKFGFERTFADTTKEIYQLETEKKSQIIQTNKSFLFHLLIFDEKFHCLFISLEV